MNSKSKEASGSELPDDLDTQFGLAPADDSWMSFLRDAEVPITLGTIGDYELLQEMRGGQGVVYRAWQPDEERYIALKRVIGGSFASDAMRRRFEREVEAVGALDHANIVKVYSVEEVDGQPMLAMEWIEGDPVNRFARKRWSKVESSHRLPLFLAICDAVQHAHQRGVIHRDLKPSNILVDGEGQPHLLDFGLAKQISPSDDLPTLTTTEQFVGTPSYAAPEQFRGSATVDLRADVYSLGVVLYELLVRQLPYPKPDHAVEWLRMLEEQEPTRPSVLQPGLHRELDVILAKAMEKDPERRYQSVDAFSGDLRRHLAGEPIVAHPPSTMYQLGKLIRRHRVPFAFGLVLLILTTTSAIVAWVQAANITRQRDRAIEAEKKAGDLLSEAQAAEQEAQRASREAAAQAARADAVLSFLVEDVLGPADPRNAPEGLMVLDALTLADRRLRTKLQQDPRTKAAIHQAIGTIYRNLAHWENAERHLSQAIELFDQVGESALRDQLAAEAILGFVLHERGLLEEAEIILLGTLEKQRSQFGEDDPGVRDTLEKLGVFYASSGNLARAAEFLCDALDRYPQGRQPTFAGRGTLNALFLILRKLGREEEADSLLRNALQRPRSANGQDQLLGSFFINLGLLDLVGHRGSVGIHHNLEVASSSNQQLIPYYERGLELARSIRGTEEARARGAFHLANLKLRSNDPPGAELLFRETIKLLRELYGEEDPLLASAYAQVAEFDWLRGDRERALQQFQTAVKITRVHLPDGSEGLGRRLRRLGRMLLDLNRFAESEQWLQEAHGLTTSAGRSFRLTTEQHLAEARIALGHSAEVLAHLRELRAQSQSRGQQLSTVLLELLEDLASQEKSDP